MAGDIYNILKKYYGYSGFRKGQEDIINAILTGRDTVAIMPTGAGKSICYQIPALAMDGITLVISPLISLMQDQVRALIAMGVRAAFLNSSLTPRQMELATENAKKGIYKIIYVAPERLETQSFRDFAQNSNISIIAVDESHCISQWGHDFRPSYTQISGFISSLPRRPVVAAFTATATEKVRRDIVSNLGLRSPFVLTRGFDRENLYFGAYKPMDKLSYTLDYVEQNKEKSGIIYCGTRKTVDELTNSLNEHGYSALPYHAGMSDFDRTNNQNEFIYDRVPIMVATTAFGMGIDKPNVRYVLHYNMPQNMEEYYQQAGRAGRDGEPAECILLYSGRDVKLNEYLIKKGGDNDSLSEEERDILIEEGLEKLKLMTFYSTSSTVCLRKRMLSYFGETFSPPCDNCSVCKGDSGRIRIDKRVHSDSGKELLIDEALFERLRVYRKNVADRSSVPVFVVLNDTTLKQLAAIKPRSIKDLRNISGFGEAKIGKYGQGFLDVIIHYEDEADF